MERQRIQTILIENGPRLKTGPGCQEEGMESIVAGTDFLEVETPGLSVGGRGRVSGEEEDGVK